MATIDEILQKILTATRAKPNQGGNGWKGHCPAHKDKSPSLSIDRGRNGGIILNCHTKCHIDSICAALNITQADLFPPKQTQTKQSTQGKPTYTIDKVYDYKDESGTLLFQAVRKRLTDPAKFPNEPRKQFRQRAPDGKGNWVWSLQGVRRVLYRLPELLVSAPGAIVWIVEGEKDVDRLRSLGLITTCNPMGAGKWLDEFSDFLAGHDCVVIEDSDDPGRAHAESVCQSLFGKAQKIRKLSFPNLPEHSDVSDWLDAGGDETALYRMAQALPEWAPSSNTHNNGSQSQSVIDATLNRIVTAQTILQTDYPEPKWAVKGVIPEGTTFIAGPPKLGKSIFALNIAVAVSEGAKALSYFDVEQGAVLYLALEDGERRIKKRLQKLITKPLSDKLEVVTKWPRLNEGGLEAIEEWIKRHNDARLLIVDTFKMLRPLRSGFNKNANTYDLDYEDVSPLTELTTKYCIALGIVTHTRKAIADDPLATVSGSFGLTGAADGVLILTRQRNQRTATLTVIGRDVEEQELALEFMPDMFLWSVLGKAGDVRQGSERKEILDLLEASDKPLSPTDIAGLLSRSPNAVRVLLWKMKGVGQVKEFGAKYQLPNFGSNIVPPMKQSSKTGMQTTITAKQSKRVPSAAATKTKRAKRGKKSAKSIIDQTGNAPGNAPGNASKDEIGNGLDAEHYRITAFSENDVNHTVAPLSTEDLRKSGNAVMQEGESLYTEQIDHYHPQSNAGNGNASEGSQILDAIDA